MDALIPGDFDREAFMKRLAELEADIVPRCGGTLYPHVKDVLGSLRKQGARIFLVSNCGARGIDNFFSYTGLGEFFDDSLAHGTYGLCKADNIALIVERHALKRPAYVRRHTARRGFGPRSRHSSHLGRLRIRNRRRS